MVISQQLTEEFKLRPDHVYNILKLLDEGNTIPFIARYRKEMTGARRSGLERTQRQIRVPEKSRKAQAGSGFRDNRTK